MYYILDGLSNCPKNYAFKSTAIKFAIAFCLNDKKQLHIFGLLMLKKLLQVVLNFWTFYFCTTHTFVYYKFSAQIQLLYAELKFSHTDDEQTFRTIT
jgi:hypothetical protein